MQCPKMLSLFRDCRGRACSGAAIVLAMSIPLFATSGCVRRTLTVNTDPQGALVRLNNEEIGRSPVTVDFLWYGDYEVVAQMEGYETLVTHHDIVAPWYQWPAIDLLAEAVWPWWIHDQRDMQFTLTTEQPIERAALIERAEAMRENALFEQE